MGAMARCQEASVQAVHPTVVYQENLKAPSETILKEVINEKILQDALNAIAAGDGNEKEFSSTEEEFTCNEEIPSNEEECTCNEEIPSNEEECTCNEEAEFPSMEEALPGHVLSVIVNKVEDARDLANCMATSKGLSEAVKQVKTLNLVCRKHYYDIARERFPVRPPCSYSESEEEGDEEEEEETESEEDDSDEEDEEECCEMSRAMANSSHHQSSEDSCCAGKYYTPSSSAGKYYNSCSSERQPVQLIRHVSFKSACLNMLQHVEDVERLRIEVDQEMQANLLIKEEIHMVDFWLSEPIFVRKWVSSCSHSLRHLALVDYGQQAIMRQSPIIRILSETCKQLQTLELRNMYLDTNDIQEMPTVTSLTLRCIKMTEYSLMDINKCMPSLVTLALISVFGVQEAKLSSPNLEVLCLGLSTSAKVVDLDLPKVKKLQLKMTCPDSLKVRAPKLAYVAVCMENRDGTEVEFENVNNLKELLFGASHFSTLSHLMRCNPLLEKIFLDVPCMALGEDGRWEGIIPHVPLRVPDMESLKESCPLLHTLSVGPGLWHSMEECFISKQEVATFRRWPALSRLIVHTVVLSLETCIALLEWLLAAVPSLQVLEIYVHLDSPVKIDHLWSACQEFRPMHAKLLMGSWKRSLNFSCFSF